LCHKIYVVKNLSVKVIDVRQRVSMCIL
jgi:hypothetical protein